MDLSGLEDAYGDSADLPALLSRLGAAKDPESVVRELRGRLVHQGHVVYPATVQVVPVLVDMVLADGCPARASMVGLVGDLAREAARAVSDRAVKARWSRMWRATLPVAASLLEDADVEVRRAAPALVASAEFDQDRLLERLLQVCVAERDEPARLGQLIAVADLLPAVPGGARAAVADRVAGIVSGGSRQLRMAGALVRRQVEPVEAGVFVEALAASDAVRWRRTWCVPGRRQSVVLWADQRLHDDRDLRLTLGRGLVVATDPGVRAAGFQVLMRVVATWRSPMAGLADAAAGALDDPDPRVRGRALFALAVSRSEGPGHADRLAAFAAGPDGYERAAAVWGLARSGDARCVPHLLSCLRSASSGCPHHEDEATAGLPDLASMDEILLETAVWSDRLLPDVVRRLADTSDGPGRRALLRVVAGWGPRAAAARPILVDGLAGPDPVLEIVALAAIGASGVPAGLLRPAFRRALAVPGADRVELIRAYARISGDTGPVRAELPRADSGDPLSPQALHLVGALGPAGGDYAARLERQMSGPGAWATLGAARSHAEITGEAGPAGRALAGLLADIGAGRPAVKADLMALRLIAELGFVDPASVSVLELLADAEPRVTGPVPGWRSIDLDSMLAATARDLLGRI